ncbi:FimV family protein [Bordetella sp. N]|uniref:type IV pilus assembly protein FimV n=1 Tax=Bordetella sp. N TaxID=1746199 RepID=UPI0007107299|nr:FimV/HubP family polar landmark protein [Bordetella sp. N]ALM83657.1 hypothetical protein ASB57_12355 [Bordetella sp. N]
MTSSTPRLSPRFSFTATRCAVAMLLTASAVAVQPAWAARLGHSRVVSAQNAPLQVLIPLTDLTPDERASLQVSVASADAWQRAGLKPPVSLSSLTLKVENGADASQRNVRLTSSEVAADPAVDVLLNIGSGAGQRLVQLTVMQTERGFPGLNAQATVGTPSRAGGAGGGNVAVRQGDTLYGIAQSHALADATIYQMLVALWRANPQAFIGNNMNRVKAGARLIVPDASTVRAIDPGEARRIFLEQAEAYARYRAGLAGAAGRGAAATQAPTTSGQIGAGAPAAQSDSGAQDRLRLSSGVPGQAGQSAEAAAQSRGDAEVSQAKADQDAKTRVDELERNVKDLNAALASNQGQGGQGSPGASGPGLTVPGVTVPGGPGAVAQAGANAPTGASGQGQGSTAAGGPGATGAGGQPGTAGQGAGAGQGGGQAGVKGQPANGQPANGQSAPNAQANGAGQAGAANDAAGQPGAAGQAGGAGQSGSGAAGNAAAGDSAGSNAGNNAGAAAGSNAGSSAGNGTGSGAGNAGNGAGTPADSAGGTGAGAAGNAGNAGNTSNAGTPGAAGAGASSSPSGTAASTPGAPAPGTSAASSTPNSATSNGAANSDSASGANTNANSGSNSATAGGKAAQPTSSLPRWLSDNLLIFMTVVLTLIAFVIAWLLRRAGARRNDEDEDMDEDLYATEIDPAAIDRRLDGIDLDLDSQPGDTPVRREPGAGPRGTLPGSSRP